MFAQAWLLLDLPLFWDNGRSTTTYMELDYFHSTHGNRDEESGRDELTVTGYWHRPPTRIRLHKIHTS